MRSVLGLVVGVGLMAVGLSDSVSAAPAARPSMRQAQQQNEECAKIDGIVRDAAQVALGNTTVRLRNVSNGQIVQSVMSDVTGKFEFTNVQEGTYVIEIVDASGNVIGTSPTLQVNDDCDPISGLIINTSAVGPAATAAGVAFFTSASGIIVLAAVGVASIAIAKDLASPSR